MPTTRDSFEKIFGNKERILAVMAHPDDLETYCGGTIARLIRVGKRVRVIKMTTGNRGSRQERISEEELTRLRLREDREAMQVLGIKPEDNIYLDLNDGEVDNSLTTIGKIVRQIRFFKPDLIITHNPQDILIMFDSNNHWVNHRDHRNAGLSTIDAAFPYSRDLLFFPEQFKETEVDSHTVFEFLLVDYYDHPETVYIQISEEEAEIRSKTLASHSSQMTINQARASTDFFTKNKDGKRYERFRHIVGD